jgi:hypothetical protein
LRRLQLLNFGEEKIGDEFGVAAPQITQLQFSTVSAEINHAIPKRNQKIEQQTTQ